MCIDSNQIKAELQIDLGLNMINAWLLKGKTFS